MKKNILLIIVLSSILIFSGCEKSQPTITTTTEETGNQNTIIASDSGDQQRIANLEKEIARLETKNAQLMNYYQDLQDNATACNTMIAEAQSHSDGSAAEMKEALENMHSCYEEYDREYRGE